MGERLGKQSSKHAHRRPLYYISEASTMPLIIRSIRRQKSGWGAVSSDTIPVSSSRHSHAIFGEGDAPTLPRSLAAVRNTFCPPTYALCSDTDLERLEAWVKQVDLILRLSAGGTNNIFVSRTAITLQGSCRKMQHDVFLCVEYDRPSLLSRVKKHDYILKHLCPMVS
ncbi:hypothetical protein HYE67_000704 [Fusarium culmorum]|uniref:Uncharacterized protein n=1 Tax=Fusarium culmorum TaxID=5516 RepID=A0A2T4GQQ8_FUSCU|nr:hypothetical protein FCULG_00002333 [Fusarium culmorum]QPC58473.1 hypothetical protein HYE67_000704 [Fusarium culmorum]